VSPPLRCQHVRDDENSSEEIAEIAIRVSLTSRVYARMVGHAEAPILHCGWKAVRSHTMEVPWTI
jgi:hypothetical protein